MRPIPRTLRPGPTATVAILLTALLAGCATEPAGAPGAAATVEGAAATVVEGIQVDGRTAHAPAPPTDLFEVTRVVDGDTIHILRGGETQKLRLLSVDTEEKLSGRSNVDPLKPETVYGQACADWAVDFFAERSLVDGVQKVGLLFPDGVERNDVYGRLLCHVVLPDGTDFNLLLVEQGRSPYFNKYGNSLICDADFRAAQDRARAAQLGIWNPGTNAAAREGAPEVKRPYDELVPWWELRARAIAEYRERGADPEALVGAADEPDGMKALVERARGRQVEVFGSIDRIFDEDDGSVTLLFRGDRSRAFRARIQPAAVPQFDRDLLERSREPFRQNYLWVTCELRPDRDGFDAALTDPAAVRPAGTAAD